MLESNKTIANNKILAGNINDVSNQLQHEKQSNANLFYQLSLQKTENVRLSNEIKKVAPTTANLFKSAINNEVKNANNSEKSNMTGVVKIKDKKPEKKTPKKEKNNDVAPIEKESSKQKSTIDDIMSAMDSVNTSPPASLETKQKKDFVVEVQSGENTKNLQKAFDDQLDELSQ